jgi:hypothetical protein
MMPENSAARALGQIIEALEPLPKEKREWILETAKTWPFKDSEPPKRPYNRKPKEPTLPLTEAK